MEKGSLVHEASVNVGLGDGSDHIWSNSMEVIQKFPCPS